MCRDRKSGRSAAEFVRTRDCFEITHGESAHRALNAGTGRNALKSLVSVGIAILSILCGFALLVHYLHQNGFWIDELYTLHTIRLPLGDMVIERLRRGHFPGYFLLVRMWYGVFPSPDFETALRSFSILFWASSIASFVPLARRFLAPAPAMMAVTMLALNTLVIRQADEVRMYTLVLLIAVWTLRAYLELLSDPAGSRMRWKATLWVGIVAGYAVSASISFLAFSMLVHAWRNRKRNPTALRVVAISVASGICVFVPGAIMHLGLREQIGIAGTEPMKYFAHLVTLFAGIQHNDHYFAPTWLLASLLGLGGMLTLFVWMTLWRHRSELPDFARACACIVIVPLIVIPLSIPASEIVGFSLLGPPRYLMSVLPAAVLLSALAFGKALESRPASVAAAAHVALAAFLLIGDYGMLTVRTERFREMVQYLDERWQPGDAVIATTHEIEDGIELYAPRIQVTAAISRNITDKTKLHELMRPLGSYPNVWILWYRARESGVLAAGEELWGTFESNNPTKPVGSLRVIRFQPATTGTVVRSSAAGA